MKATVTEWVHYLPFTRSTLVARFSPTAWYTEPENTYQITMYRERALCVDLPACTS
jgi:hypothetical protein